MSNLHHTIHELARLAGITITDPKTVQDAHAAVDKWRELKREPAPLDLANTLCSIPVKQWDKAIADHAAAVARHQTIASGNTHTMSGIIERATRASADDYLKQLAPQVEKITQSMLDAASKITTRDAAESIARLEGDRLHTFERGVVVLGGYANLCAQIVRSHPSQHEGGRTIVGELAVIHPGTIPVSLYERDHVSKPRRNTDTEARHIDIATKLTRAPRTAIADHIADVAMGLEPFALQVPASVDAINDALTLWDAVNRWAWV